MQEAFPKRPVWRLQETKRLKFNSAIAVSKLVDAAVTVDMVHLFSLCTDVQKDQLRQISALKSTDEVIAVYKDST